MHKSHWRETSRRVIMEIVEKNPEASIEELRKLASAAYPFGPRKYHPYKIWCDEVNALLPWEGKRLATQADVRNMWVK